tara:strand:+ start:2250 stop:3185 length:936 start_codon:yes stop_codon:yes gene_type:complete
MTFYDLESKPDVIKYHLDNIKPFVKLRLDNSSLNKHLKAFVETNLEDIIIGKPKELMSINRKFKLHKSYKDSLRKKVSKIFDYKAFTVKKQNPENYDGYDLAKKLNVRTCLYCNRVYTITVTTDNSDKGKITRPQFDHFIDKGTNPLLALSIYNLIPSCSICNSTLKGRKKFNLKNYIHPFIEDCVGEYNYKFTPFDVDSILGNKSNLEVTITPKDKDSEIGKKIEKSSATFRLNEIMTAHSEELKDLFDIRYKFSERYFIELFSTYNRLGLDKEDIYRVVFGAHFNSKDFDKRPFSKLKRDILEELEIVQ